MRVHIADHPLITHKLTALRDKNTPSPVFRQLVEELVTLLAYEATRDVRVDKVVVETPVTSADGVKLSRPRPIIIPILRAGLGMLEGIVKLLPTAEVGFLGIKRNEETLQPYTYANRLPDDLTNRQVFIIDPMLATGGTLIDSIDYVFQRGATDVTAIPARTGAKMPAWLRLCATTCQLCAVASSAPIIARRNTQPSG